jgi:hypothetical protein
MALRGMESWDIYDTANITDVYPSVGPGSVVAAAGRCSTQAFLGTGVLGTGPFVGVSATTTDGFCGWAYSGTGYSTTQHWSVNKSDSTPLAFIRVLADGSIEGWKGFNTILGSVVCSTGANLILTGHYDAIGVEFNIAASGGYLRIYVNGILQADSGSVDMTTAFTSGQWGAFSFTPVGYIDDMYWGDTDISDPENDWDEYLGDLHVEGQVAVTDAIDPGTYRDWTPNTGTDHGALVDDNPPDDSTTYVSSSTVGQVETFAFPAIVPATALIYGIQLMPNALKTTFATRTMANVVYTNGTLDVGTTTSPAQTNYKYYPQVYGKNPVTGTVWSTATANAMEGGLKIIS